MERSHVYLDIAGLQIDFCTRFPEYVRERCKRYLASEQLSGRESGDGRQLSGRESGAGRYPSNRESGAGRYPSFAAPQPILHLEATDEDILKADRDNVGPMEAELYAMTIPLSELSPGLGRLMTHGVAIECDGKAFIFTAESGVGKSTHAFLWQKYLGADRVRVINGDKPILWFRPDGEILACGSPWSGKERLDENVQVPLGGICLLTRLEDAPGFGTTVNAPYITRATRGEAFDFLMHQVFIPRGLEGRLQTLSLLERLYGQIPVYNLYINMTRECVRVSSECLLNNISDAI